MSGYRTCGCFVQHHSALSVNTASAPAGGEESADPRVHGFVDHEVEVLVPEPSPFFGEEGRALPPRAASPGNVGGLTSKRSAGSVQEGEALAGVLDELDAELLEPGAGAVRGVAGQP